MIQKLYNTTYNGYYYNGKNMSSLDDIMTAVKGSGPSTGDYLLFFNTDDNSIKLYKYGSQSAEEINISGQYIFYAVVTYIENGDPVDDVEKILYVDSSSTSVVNANYKDSNFDKDVTTFTGLKGSNSKPEDLEEETLYLDTDGNDDKTFLYLNYGLGDWIPVITGLSILKYISGESGENKNVV